MGCKGSKLVDVSVRHCNVLTSLCSIGNNGLANPLVWHILFDYNCKNSTLSLKNSLSSLLSK